MISGASQMLGQRSSNGQVADPNGRGGTSVFPTYVRELIRQRRSRDRIAGCGLFANPAWEILLDLTAARLEGKSICVSSACHAANVPARTALRWLNLLINEGVLVKRIDGADARRAIVTTSDRVHDMMLAHLDESGRKLAMVFTALET